MYKVNQKTAPYFFLLRFQKLSHCYLNILMKLNYIKLITQFQLEGHWNSFFSSKEKITTMHKFKAIAKW